MSPESYIRSKELFLVSGFMDNDQVRYYNMFLYSHTKVNPIIDNP